MGADLFNSRMFLDAAKSPQFIVCECGVKILVLPDLRLMGNSIETHAAEHKHMKHGSLSDYLEVVRIENLLIKQLFKIIADCDQKP